MSISIKHIHMETRFRWGKTNFDENYDAFWGKEIKRKYKKIQQSEYETVNIILNDVTVILQNSFFSPLKPCSHIYNFEISAQSSLKILNIF